MKIELENGSVIEAIDYTGKNIRSKRGNEQLNNIKLTKQDRLDAYNMILGDDEEHINSFFEGYRPPYYFKNDTENLTESQIQDLISKAIITGKDKFASCTSLSSKGFTLDDLQKTMEQLNQLPPSPVEIEIGRIAWEILASQLNIHMMHDSNKISSLFGVRIVFYKGDEIKFNQMRVKYNNGKSKVIDVFEYTCDYDSMYKYIFREEI